MAWGYGEDEGNGLFRNYTPTQFSTSGSSQRGSAQAGNPTMGEGNNWTWQYGSPQDYKEKMTGQNSGRGGYAGSYGGGSSGNKSTRSVTRTTFEGEMPELPKLPTLTYAKPDKRAIRALTQQLAGPTIRSLREQMAVAANEKSDNPNVRRMTLREALQGYGTGLDKALSGASVQARNEHMQELNVQNAEAQANYQTNVNALMQSYNNAFNRYLASATRTTESNTTDSSGMGSGGVVRRNVWGTPSIGPSFQEAWDARNAGTTYGNFVASRRGY